MPLVKFERIVSCSSEDPAHPASNLLLSKEYARKWKCKDPGEKSASVIIQLREPCVITGIDIGNESSSFIEILVSRTSTPDDFKVMLLMSSFMTPMDARSETNRNRVRMFSQKDLSESVQKEKWDRVKVVCTQPFSKHLQYGLSFLVFHTNEVKEDVKYMSEGAGQKLGRFALKEEDQSSISVGSFFSRRKDIIESSSPPAVTVTGAAAVREASAAAYRASQEHHGKRKNSENSPGPSKKKPESSLDAEKKRTKIFNQDQVKKKKESDVPIVTPSPSSKQRRPKASDLDESNASASSTRQSSSQYDKKSEKVKNPPANVTYKPFNKLLEGVEIVISGYVNPGRADIRDKALQMGAKYKPDWCNTSTHLICAFANTPKFQQVKGKGIIVVRDWIDECYKEHKKLNWRRFAVDDADKDTPDNRTDAEVWELPPAAEEVNESLSASRSNRNSLAIKDTRLMSNSSSDSEDEIERIKAKQLLKKNTIVSEGIRRTNESQRKMLSKETKAQSTESDVYEGSTDVDSEEEKNKQESMWAKQKGTERMAEDLPSLPDFFRDKMFYLSSDLSECEKQRISRYIIAFGGEVLGSQEKPPQYVLAWKKDTVPKDVKISLDSVFISPDWIWECNDRRKLVPYGPFQLL